MLTRTIKKHYVFERSAVIFLRVATLAFFPGNFYLRELLHCLDSFGMGLAYVWTAFF